jgi:hypothetical protein
MSKKLTHIGIVYHRSVWGSTPRKVQTELRETKLYFITSNGRKYRKSDGGRAGDKFAIDSLLIDTIKGL